VEGVDVHGVRQPKLDPVGDQHVHLVAGVETAPAAEHVLERGGVPAEGHDWDGVDYDPHPSTVLEY
jgi:hypothetical protein